MKKIFAILLALSLCGCSTSVSDENIITDSLCIVGASFAYPENGWFEMACSFTTLVIMHTHNVNVCSNVGVHAPFTEAFDYVIKGYTALCQSLENNPKSKWYGTEGGKPVDIIVCTHWHDARRTYNSSVRKLDKKWDCVRLCKFDEQIGFTMYKPDPVTGKQISVYYAHPDKNGTEIMDGVEYGWHPRRGRNSEIQQRMADIFCKCF